MRHRFFFDSLNVAVELFAVNSFNTFFFISQAIKLLKKFE